MNPKLATKNYFNQIVGVSISLNSDIGIKTSGDERVLRKYQVAFGTQSQIGIRTESGVFQVPGELSKIRGKLLRNVELLEEWNGWLSCLRDSFLGVFNVRGNERSNCVQK